MSVVGDREVALDPTHFTSGWIEGRVTGAPFERLMIAAEPDQERDRNTELAAPVDPAGNFRIEVVPGDYVLRVIDLLSGAIVHVVEGPIRVRSDERVTVDLEPEIARVRVKVVPRHAGDPVVFGILGMGGTGKVFSDGRQTEFELFAPPGRLSLSAQSTSGLLGPFGGTSYPIVGSVDLVVEPGGTYDVELPIAAPPTDDELNAKPTTVERR